MARERLLVAVSVPPPVDAEVDGLRRALGDRALGRIGPHLTLVPPVNVADGGLDAALAVLRSAAAETPPLRLRLGPAATFHPRNPVVYLAVGGDLDGLRALRDRCLRPPLARPVTHDFVPHVTIANRMAPPRIPSALAAVADFAVDVVVDRARLLRQEEGRSWRAFADAPLAAPAVVGRGGLPLELATSEGVPPDAAVLVTPSGPAAGPSPGAAWAVTARREGEPVGVATGWVSGPLCLLAALAVATGERRQGVGHHLLAAVEALAWDRGCLAVEALAPGGDASDALFGGSGWTATDAGRGWRRWARRSS